MIGKNLAVSVMFTVAVTILLQVTQSVLSCHNGRRTRIGPRFWEKFHTMDIAVAYNSKGTRIGGWILEKFCAMDIALDYRLFGARILETIASR